MRPGGLGGFGRRRYNPGLLSRISCGQGSPRVIRLAAGASLSSVLNSIQRESSNPVNFQMTQTSRSWWRTPFNLFAILSGAVALYLLATVPLRWDQQAIFGAICLALAVIINRYSKSSTATLALAILSAFSTVRYAY